MSPRRRILPLFIPHLGCPHHCVFCDQRRVSGSGRSVGPPEVTAALAALTEDVEELAFYGGSFTLLPRETQTALLKAAAPYLARGTIRRIRVSTRPDGIDPAALALLRGYGVETVELGAQSMDDGVLRACGRGHSAADTERAARLVREGGFSLVLQMMTGLPGSSDEKDVETARRIAALAPDGVRIYPTVVLRDTPLYALWSAGRYREHSVEDAVRVCAEIVPLFDGAGIPILRLGLNPTEALSGGEACAGAYHPALGELVRARIYLQKARSLLHGSSPGGRVVLGVCKSDFSQMTGQRRCNLAALAEEFQTESIRVTAAEVPKGTVVLL